MTVTNPGGLGSGTCAGCFTVTNRPGVFTLSPASRPQGATSQTIAINGTGFVNGATVAFTGTGITINSTTFVNANQLTMNIPVAANATSGSRNVTVTNPDAGTRTVNNAFSVTARPLPTAVAPPSRARNTVGNVMITGTGFVSGATVVFSGAASPSTPRPSTAHAADGQHLDRERAATGARYVTVTNPDTGTGTCTNCFTVT